MPRFAYQSVYIIYITTQDNVKSDDNVIVLDVCSVVCQTQLYFQFQLCVCCLQCCFGFDISSFAVASITLILSEIESTLNVTSCIHLSFLAMEVFRELVSVKHKKTAREKQ